MRFERKLIMFVSVVSLVMFTSMYLRSVRAEKYEDDDDVKQVAKTKKMTQAELDAVLKFIR